MNKTALIIVMILMWSCIQEEEVLPLNESKVVVISDEFPWGYTTVSTFSADQYLTRDRHGLLFRSYNKERFDLENDVHINGYFRMEFEYNIRDTAKISSGAFWQLSGDLAFGLNYSVRDI